MTATGLIYNIKERFPKIKEDGAEINKIVKRTGIYSEDDISEIFEILKEKRFGDYPRWNNIRDIAKETGLKPVEQMVYYRRCICSTTFPMDSYACPRCGSRSKNKIHYSEVFPHGYVQVQRECAICKHYINRASYCLGPVCDVYGKELPSMQECKDCRCRRCCYEEYLIKNDPNAFKDLDKEVRELNSTT